ncbi:MAG: carbamoyl-phosphate synthase large subunit [bacterium]
MPKRTDIRKILIIGSGPIIIGQACEFDYSGTQACKALKQEGYSIVLVNSNPATIMTDPEFADRTYVEPITAEIVEKIIQRERPDALLPTLGGQTALNVTVELAESGALDRYGVELIGAKFHAIRKAESREEFKRAMESIGLECPRSVYTGSLGEAHLAAEKIGYPIIIRPSFTLGGTGGGIAYNREELDEIVRQGLDTSPVHEVLLEESVIGWKEYELEVMRDLKDNVVIICSIENFDPMGVHTGDSITVAPAQTLTDKEYQIMRDAAISIIREIGVDTGGSNIQFAVNPQDGRMVVIEMNPRVSRSSALASKATGFPIAKIAAKLAVGYTLDEIPNDITRKTLASFEPTLDYVVVKFPRFVFEKFPQADQVLTTQMKSVGEVMAIGRTFKEALQKAIRSLETNSYGLEQRVPPPRTDGEREQILDEIRKKLRIPNSERVWYIADAIRFGMDIDEIANLSKIDPWFLWNIREIVEMEEEIKKCRDGIPESILREAKKMGFSDYRLARLTGGKEIDVRRARKSAGIEAAFKTVDTCGAEFEAYTPYLYSTYEEEDESNPSGRRKIVILGSGPNRIGQGIEFDYCCVHAAFALKEDGFETIMVNCNPETVSTDYDTSDRLYFEPLAFEDVMNIVERERPYGVIVQFGGQTPLKLAKPLEAQGVPIIGTSPDNIDRAEDRDRFRNVITKLGLKQPESDVALSFEEARKIASRIGYPVLLRPSYVLGGRAMEIVYDERSLEGYIAHAVRASSEHPVLVDKFLERAIEVDVDALCDGDEVFIGGIMEHIEEAGIHSGDSACSLPPYSLAPATIDEIKSQVRALAFELEVKGLMNVQMAVKDGEIYVLEVNPRASRTVPFVSKAIGIPLAKAASRIMVGRKLRELGLIREVTPKHIAVKESVFPFIRFPGVDTLLGPEMKSTGEVMGLSLNFANAFAKAQLGAGVRLPLGGKVFISVSDADKKDVVEIARKLQDMGFGIVATEGTARYLRGHGIETELVHKLQEDRPNIIDRIKSGEIDLVINTPTGKRSITDAYKIRRAALVHNIAYFTTVAGAKAAVHGIASIKKDTLAVRPLQDYYERP